VGCRENQILFPLVGRIGKLGWMLGIRSLFASYTLHPNPYPHTRFSFRQGVGVRGWGVENQILFPLFRRIGKIGWMLGIRGLFASYTLTPTPHTRFRLDRVWELGCGVWKTNSISVVRKNREDLLDVGDSGPLCFLHPNPYPPHPFFV
jgi:hypothetical protein